MIVKIDKFKVFLRLMIPFFFIIFIAINGVTKDIQNPILGINRLFFILPILIIFSLFIFLNIGSFFIKDYGINFNNGVLKYRIFLLNEISVENSNIKEFKITKQKQIAVVLNNPDDFIDTFSSNIKKWLFRRNLRLLKTPLIISPNDLKGYPNEIVKALNKELNKKRDT